MNRDGVVNSQDVDPFVDVLLRGPYRTEADMNEDEVVNGLDVDLFLGVMLSTSLEAVPEPSSTMLLVTATIFLTGENARFINT